MQQFKAKNNGTISADDYETCLYRKSDGNHCAVGAFIPDNENEALAYTGTVKDLTKRFSYLTKYMPFDIDGLSATCNADYFELVAPCTVLTMDILEKTKDYSAFSQRNCTQCFNGASMQYYAQDKRYFCNVCWHVVKE